MDVHPRIEQRLVALVRKHDGRHRQDVAREVDEIDRFDARGVGERLGGVANAVADEERVLQLGMHCHGPPDVQLLIAPHAVARRRHREGVRQHDVGDRLAEEHPLEEDDRFGEPLADGDEPPLGLSLREPLDGNRDEAIVQLAERKHRERDDRRQPGRVPNGCRAPLYGAPHEKRSNSPVDDGNREHCPLNASQGQHHKAGGERSDCRADRVDERQDTGRLDLRSEFPAQRHADNRKEHPGDE